MQLAAGRVCASVPVAYEYGALSTLSGARMHAAAKWLYSRRHFVPEPCCRCEGQTADVGPKHPAFQRQHGSTGWRPDTSQCGGLAGTTDAARRSSLAQYRDDWQGIMLIALNAVEARLR